MVVYAAQGDPRTTMALLWRGAGGEPPARRRGPGPRQQLSVEAIVDAAITLADRDGMAALSMRSVGEQLGRTAMALYTYVPGKRELIDLMHDRVMAELPTDYSGHEGWRAALTAWAEDAYAFYLRHPWVLQVSRVRPVLGPNEFAAEETVVGILRHGTGLDARTLRGVVGSLNHFVRGAAQVAADARQAVRETGVTDEEWWASRSAVLQQVAPDLADRFPGLVWLETARAKEGTDAGAYLERDAEVSFRDGLALLLDGIEAAAARS
ncbi:TetR/AcrR family transcriptional regulator [Streptomyces sp. 7-21]|uniref:TetR/AcrR family transcriptional regulator n=1 Tax=Streptomyces sp. 7-21 TaxID=2802283 RepID=UPI00191CC77E|nr:TetR/AcrR family transcriptional regulator [Streptomyces sp. 7-21]MBL1068742.1 TetR/AcrR family transcriptional regulator C-terminal domain-containing protein [Streptomyces sp. 7-21]